MLGRCLKGTAQPLPIECPAGEAALAVSEGAARPSHRFGGEHGYDDDRLLAGHHLAFASEQPPREDTVVLFDGHGEHLLGQGLGSLPVVDVGVSLAHGYRGVAQVEPDVEFSLLPFTQKTRCDTIAVQGSLQGNREAC